MEVGRVKRRRIRNETGYETYGYNLIDIPNRKVNHP
jgi:hypothetical protein